MPGVDGYHGEQCGTVRVDVDPAIGRMDTVHRIVWRRVYGPIPKAPNGKLLEVDELCEITLCVRPDHLDLKTKRDNVKRRGPTRGPNKRAAAAEIQPTIGNSAAATAVRVGMWPPVTSDLRAGPTHEQVIVQQVCQCRISTRESMPAQAFPEHLSTLAARGFGVMNR